MKNFAMKVKTSCNQAQSAACDPFDMYLAGKGLWRKPVAKDGSCLFRAVAEQVFNSQAYHLQVREACVNYMERNKAKFETFEDLPELDEHIFKLRNAKEWAGPLEIIALSQLYRHDFVVYQEKYKPAVNVTRNGFEKTVTLCYTGENHYDIVYPASFAESAAICQSIVYGLLYSRVFNMDEEISHGIEMIRNKAYHKHRRDSLGSTSDKAESPTLELTNDLARTDVASPVLGDKHTERKNLKEQPPFPYRIAKALDPEIYRNVEIDVWQDTRKDEPDEEKLCVFSTGDKCQVTLEGHGDRLFNAHIQELSPNKGPVTVFVEELAEKHKIPFDNLQHAPIPQHGPFVCYKKSTGFYVKPQLQEFDDGQHKRKAKKKHKDFPATMIPTVPPRFQHTVDCNASLKTYQNLNKCTNRSQLPRSPKFRSIIDSAGHPKKSWLQEEKFRLSHSSPTLHGAGFCNLGGQDFKNYPMTTVYPPSHPMVCPVHHRNPCITQNDQFVMAQPGNYSCHRDDFPTLETETALPNQKPDNCGDSPLDSGYEESDQHSSLNSSSGGAGGAVTSPQPIPSSRNHASVHATGHLPGSSPYNNQSPSDQYQFLPLSPSQTYSPTLSSTAVPFYPFLIPPGVDNLIGPVNYNAGPSREPGGTDLPIGDASTMRFFYNLGVEYHRATGFAQQQQQQQQQQQYVQGNYSHPLIMYQSSPGNGVAQSSLMEYPQQNNSKETSCGFYPGVGSPVSSPSQPAFYPQPCASQSYPPNGMTMYQQQPSSTVMYCTSPPQQQCCTSPQQQQMPY